MILIININNEGGVLSPFFFHLFLTYIKFTLIYNDRNYDIKGKYLTRIYVNAILFVISFIYTLLLICE